MIRHEVVGFVGQVGVDLADGHDAIIHIAWVGVVGGHGKIKIICFVRVQGGVGLGTRMQEVGAKGRVCLGLGGEQGEVRLCGVMGVGIGQVRGDSFAISCDKCFLYCYGNLKWSLLKMIVQVEFFHVGYYGVTKNCSVHLEV